MVFLYKISNVLLPLVHSTASKAHFSNQLFVNKLIHLNLKNILFADFLAKNSAL